MKQIKADFEQVKIIDLEKDEKYCSYCQAGLSVLDNGDEDKILVNLLNMKCYKTQHDALFYLDLKNHLQATPFGLSITDRILLQIMGKEDLAEFLTQREIFFNEYRQKLFSNPNFELDNLN